ncbi:hypothetical protein GY26_15970 [Gammaproteobacteria bacterium MFB021]|nr:hypothetical protein GY26_15970 [Gammaproteobacteria bacterium MFB021]
MAETLPDVPMDREPQITPQASVDTVKFGDGYEQRRPSGINHIKDQASVSWSRLRRHEFDSLFPFLKNRLGVTPFLWTPPGGSAPRKWVCETLSHAQANAVLWRVSATFREVVA